MKCPNCGAEVSGGFCSYCGAELPKQPVNIVNNYYGSVTNNQGQSGTPNVGNGAGFVGATCPNCGSTKISFNRESSATRGLHKTVGVCKSCGNTWVTSQDIKVSPKNKTVALVLCILTGYFGGHMFYVGKTGMGVLYLFTMGLFGIGWIIDIVKLVNGTFTDVNGNPLK